jgi:putative membrane protein
MTKKTWFTTLIAALAVLWIWLAIAPNDRSDWLLENVLLVLGVALLLATRKRLPLSGISYTMILVFFCLHIIGAHYTYAEVPYDAAFKKLTGASFNELVGWKRNNYDRVVHFSYGLLLAYPIRELFLRVANVRGFWGYFLPLDLTMSTSMLYELVEWLSAALFGSGLGAAFLGSQGDEWDAQKDMALASLGALITMTVTAIVNWKSQRDFAAEWVESLRVHRPAPLGEVELRRRRDEAAAGLGASPPRG